jgi:hypothetical protein
MGRGPSKKSTRRISTSHIHVEPFPWWPIWAPWCGPCRMWAHARKLAAIIPSGECGEDHVDVNQNWRPVMGS